MILDKLVKICNEIRFLEASYKMPPNVNIENELREQIICDKEERELAIAKQLYICVKEYALKECQPSGKHV